MSARKLQQEMDRVFKRVTEGTAIFDTIYNKLQSAPNQSQKEKLEQDLKREIKKLQKLRDQIKTWIASNDVRDKKQLMEQRRLIENDMERFKAVEREVKTKAYSKEGLSNGAKANDPYEKEKRETAEFIQSKIEELESQIETLEEEQDQLQNSTKKSKRDNSKQERINEIDHHLERHKWHIAKMELMIHMIENDTLATEAVMDLQEDINYYVESNQEVDFAEDEAIYDELNLVGDSEGELLETIVRDDTYTLEDLAQDLSKEAAKEAAQREKEEKERERREREKGKEPLPPSSASATPVPSTSAQPQPQQPITAPSSSSSSPSRRSQSPAAGLTPLPPPSVPATKSTEPARKGAHLAQGGYTVPSPSPGPQQQRMPSVAGRDSPLRSSNSPAPTSSSALPPPPGTVPGMAPRTPTQQQQRQQQSIQANVNNISQKVANPLPTQQSTDRKNTSLPDLRSLPPGLQDLVHCMDAAAHRLKDPQASFEVPSVAKLIQSSFLHTPDALMSDQPRYYHPQNPFPTPDYYPQESLPSLEDPAVFREMHVETLFYVFYYCQNTHQQYLAAKELKSRSWRFHKQFLTWFQRQENPKLITPEYEEGTYRFFDFEGSWLQRRKVNFKFEFKYLENEI